MRKGLAVLAVAGCVAVLAGCGDGPADKGSVGKDEVSFPAPSVSEVEIPTPFEETTPGEYEAGEVAENGVEVAVGATVRLKVEAQGKKGLLDVTVTRIEKGSPSDDFGYEKDAGAAAETPYYMHAKIKNAGKTDLSGAYFSDFVGLADDEDSSPLRFNLGVFEKCPAAGEQADLRPGVTFETCSTALAKPGVKVVGARWEEEPYAPDFITETGVTWRAGR